MTPMATPPATYPFDPTRFDGRAMFHQMTADEYDNHVRTGFFEEDDPVEFLEGFVVLKMPADPPHDGSTMMAQRLLDRLVPAAWGARCQSGTKLDESRPEPDVAVVRAPLRQYFVRHPEPVDLGLVVEVSDSSLSFDRRHKARVYARDGIPVYWIVNLIDRRVEVYTDPTGPADLPQYQTRQDYPAGTAVPVVLDGVAVGTVPVDELLP